MHGIVSYLYIYIWSLKSPRCVRQVAPAKPTLDQAAPTVKSTVQAYSQQIRSLCSVAEGIGGAIAVTATKRLLLIFWVCQTYSQPI
jgi:hypothetical protein